MKNPVFRLSYLKTFGKASIDEDARLGVYTYGDRAKALLGRPRPYDPMEVTEHQRLAEAVNTDSTIEERKSDLERQEQLITWYSRPWVLRLGLALAFLVETLSAVQIFASCGEEMPERLFFGLTAACSVFILTYTLVRLANPKPKEETP